MDWPWPLLVRLPGCGWAYRSTYIGKHLPSETKVIEEPPTALTPLEQVDLHIEHAAWSDAIDVLDGLLAADGTNEAAVQRLMMVLARLKRRGEALRLTSGLLPCYRKAFTHFLQQKHRLYMRPCFEETK